MNMTFMKLDLALKIDSPEVSTDEAIQLLRNFMRIGSTLTSAE